MEYAVEPASAAVSIVVFKDYFTTTKKFVTEVFQLVIRATSYRRRVCKIVLTNGCFDIFQRGHIAFLEQAQALGDDIPIEGLNSDDSVRRIKEANQPINSLEDRAQGLAALSCADLIVAFGEDTASELIHVIRPAVSAKGGKHSRETLPEADLLEQIGGRVELLPYLEEHSTTGVIRKIRGLFDLDQAFRRSQLLDAGDQQRHGS